jgi:hypothetical protein
LKYNHNLSRGIFAKEDYCSLNNVILITLIFMIDVLNYLGERKKLQDEQKGFFYHLQYV